MPVVKFHGLYTCYPRMVNIVSFALHANCRHIIPSVPCYRPDPTMD